MEIKNIIGYEDLYTIDIEGNVYGKISKKYLKQHYVLGYLTVQLYKNNKKKGFKTHRLIALHFIDNPLNHPTVDHTDGVKSNNSIENLRWANSSEQNMNTGIRLDNTSGFRGVSFHEPLGKYVARIQIDGKRKFLGLFDTPEEASAVREAEATILFGVFKRQV